MTETTKETSHVKQSSPSDLSRCRHCGHNPCRCTDCGGGTTPCGQCERCAWEHAAFFGGDHPAQLTHKEFARL